MESEADTRKTLLEIFATAEFLAGPNKSNQSTAPKESDLDDQ